MANVLASAGHFLRGTWGACALAFAAVTDPLTAAKGLGLVDQQTAWLLGEGGMRALFAFAAFAWMFVWFHRQKAKFEAGSPDADMPLHVACRWIARDSIWAGRFLAKNDEHWVELVADELMSKVLLGKIHLYGRPSLHPGAGYGPMGYVTPAFKAVATWEKEKLVTPEPPTHMWSTDSRVKPASYSQVSLDAKDVRRVWPRKSLLYRWTRRSPVERVGDYGPIFADQDRYYEENGGVSPTPLEAMMVIVG